jgi:hypothetical protein
LSRSIAVGSEKFVERIKTGLGTKALGRLIHNVSEGREIWQPDKSYNAVFDLKKSSIGLENTYNWGSLP